MTPPELAKIHAAAFTLSRPWSSAEFSDLLSQPTTHLFTQRGGFALVQTVAGEAELLTIAVYPEQQGIGIGRALMHDWTRHVDVELAFLEVAADNLAALALYKSFGFAEVGRRAAYYARESGPSTDAIVMRALLT